MIKLSKREICEKCSNDNPFLIQWHHINPEEKKFEISTAIQKPKKYPDKVILKEIDKCKVSHVGQSLNKAKWLICVSELKNKYGYDIGILRFITVQTDAWFK